MNGNKSIYEFSGSGIDSVRSNVGRPNFSFDFGANDIISDLIANPQPINTTSPLANKFWQSWIGNQPSTSGGLSRVDEIDSSPIASTSASAEESSLLSAPALAPEAEEATEAVETLAEGAEVAEGPIGWAKEAGQIGGQFLNMGMNALSESNINSSLQNTLASSHGIGVTEIAQAQFVSDKSTLGMQNAMGAAGAFIGGPLGVLIGRGIASLIPTTPNLNVANSSYGTFNPQDSSLSTSQSQSSAELSSGDSSSL